MRTYFLNTDAKFTGGISLHSEWLRRGIAVTSGPSEYRDDLRTLAVGDRVLMYANQSGLVAIGYVEGPDVVDVEGEGRVNAQEPVEYQRRVRWTLDLSSAPIPPAELSKLLFVPRRAVMPVAENNPKLQQLLVALSTRPTADVHEYYRQGEAVAAAGRVRRPDGILAPVQSAGTALQFFRDPLVRAWTLQRASGFCELCRTEAPFRTDTGTPFLESHHVLPLAKGGADTPANTAAVCPNCHRELHYGTQRASKTEALRLVVLAAERSQG